MLEIAHCDVYTCLYNKKGKCKTPKNKPHNIVLKGPHIRTWGCDMYTHEGRVEKIESPARGGS